VRLHVVTAVTRPANLAEIASSLAAACCTARIDLVWHWRFDWQREHIGGQKLKNDALDAISDGWVWMLDDDTIAHSEILQAWAQHALSPSSEAIVFGQRRADGRILVADPDNARVGSIDIGQAFLRRDVIGTQRLPEHYDGDGVFLEAVLANAVTIYDNRLLSFHNRLEVA
jgi:hypothetical protein